MATKKKPAKKRKPEPAWPATEIVRRKVAELVPYARNAKTHPPKQVERIAAAIKEWGWTTPILIDAKGTVIAGHGRLLAAEKLEIDDVPCVVARGWTQKQKDAYRVADNQLAVSDWDEDLLKVEIGGLGDFDLGLLGFDLKDLEGILETNGQVVEEDEVPEPPVDPITKPGDLWALGDHRVLCGDATKSEDVARVMDAAKAALVHADPPYGMGKEKDGIANDNLYAEKLDAFQMAWWQAARPHVEDNASAYVWGNTEDLWRLWYVGGLRDSERLTFRSEIAWDKREGNPTLLVDGVPFEGRRMFQPTERCLFFMLGEQGFNNNADNYWEGWDSVVDYLRAEKEKTGWDIAKFKRLAGHSETSGCHWFDRSQWSFPTKEVYESWQDAAREHDAFKREHDELKREFYATRAHFDNTHGNMTDVWSFQRVTGDERHGHATPKPVAMIGRVIKSSAPEGSVVLDPFLGSGTTLIAAEQLGRTCYGIEIEPRYADVIIERWQNLTGKKATLEATGATFEATARKRKRKKK